MAKKFDFALSAALIASCASRLAVTSSNNHTRPWVATLLIGYERTRSTHRGSLSSQAHSCFWVGSPASKLKHLPQSQNTKTCSMGPTKGRKKKNKQISRVSHSCGIQIRMNESIHQLIDAWRETTDLDGVTLN
jgi:hypothetical protein